MLPQRHRLRRSEDIRTTLRTGRCVRSPWLVMCIGSQQKGLWRGAVVVGRRVSQSAVRRHQLQRWLREIMKEWVGSQGELFCCDMVWVAQPKSGHIRSSAELREKIAPYLSSLAP